MSDKPEFLIGYIVDQGVYGVTKTVNAKEMDWFKRFQGSVKAVQAQSFPSGTPKKVMVKIILNETAVPVGVS